MGERKKIVCEIKKCNSQLYISALNSENWMDISLIIWDNIAISNTTYFMSNILPKSNYSYYDNSPVSVNHYTTDSLILGTFKITKIDKSKINCCRRVFV